MLSRSGEVGNDLFGKRPQRLSTNSQMRLTSAERSDSGPAPLRSHSVPESPGESRNAYRAVPVVRRVLDHRQLRPDPDRIGPVEARDLLLGERQRGGARILARVGHAGGLGNREGVRQAGEEGEGDLARRGAKLERHLQQLAAVGEAVERAVPDHHGAELAAVRQYPGLAVPFREAVENLVAGD